MPRLHTIARSWLAALAALALAGCFGREADKVDENAFPAGYKTAIVDSITKSLDDPTNLREAAISEPVLRPMQNYTRYASCLRYNPRNRNHDYMGLAYRIAYFYAGELNQILPATAEQCNWAAFRPFPELEKICLGAICN